MAFAIPYIPYSKKHPNSASPAALRRHHHQACANGHQQTHRLHGGAPPRRGPAALLPGRRRRPRAAAGQPVPDERAGGPQGVRRRAGPAQAQAQRAAEPAVLPAAGQPRQPRPGRLPVRRHQAQRDRHPRQPPARRATRAQLLRPERVGRAGLQLFLLSVHASWFHVVINKSLSNELYWTWQTGPELLPFLNMFPTI